MSHSAAPNPTDPSSSPADPTATWQPSLQATLKHLYVFETIAHLVGILSHDLRSLLSPTTSYCQLALATLPPDHPLVPNLRDMLDANTQAVRLLESLQKFASAHFGPLVSLHPSVLLTDLLPRLRTLLGATIFIRLPEVVSDDPITTDPYQLEQALRLLAMRAATRMPEGGEVRLHIETAIIGPDHTPTHITPRHGTYTAISMTDTGSPIPPSELHTLFEPPLSNHTKDLLQYLQMATVAAILRRLRGGLSATSTAAQGTCITLFLPRTTR